MVYRSAPDREVEIPQELARAMSTLEKRAFVRVELEPGRRVRVRTRPAMEHWLYPGCVLGIFVALGGCMVTGAIAGGDLAPLAGGAIVFGIPGLIVAWWLWTRVRGGRFSGFELRIGDGIERTYSRFGALRLSRWFLEEWRIRKREGRFLKVDVETTHGRKPSGRTDVLRVRDPSNRLETRLVARVATAERWHTILSIPVNEANAHPAKRALEAIFESLTPPLLALETGRQIEAIDREHPEGSAERHYRRGRALRSADRDAEAIEELRRAVELDPGHALAHNQLGLTIHETRGDAAEALAALERAAALDPENAAAAFNLALALRRAERHLDAIAALERSVELDEAKGSKHAETSRKKLEKWRAEGE